MRSETHENTQSELFWIQQMCKVLVNALGLFKQLCIKNYFLFQLALLWCLSWLQSIISSALKTVEIVIYYYHISSLPFHSVCCRAWKQPLLDLFRQKLWSHFCYFCTPIWEKPCIGVIRCKHPLWCQLVCVFIVCFVCSLVHSVTKYFLLLF